jgi:hypothetical protein
VKAFSILRKAEGMETSAREQYHICLERKGESRMTGKREQMMGEIKKNRLPVEKIRKSKMASRHLADR